MKQLADISVIILDFDGVIVESNGIKDEVFKQIFNRYPGIFEDVYNYHVTNVFESRVKKFAYLAAKLDKKNDLDFQQELLDEFSQLTLEKMKKVAFVHGAELFLSQLHHRFPLYLASVTPIEDLEIILKELGIRHFFKDVYGCPPWNKPAAVQDIISKEKIDPCEALLVGDSAGDQHAAAINNIKFLARNSGLPFTDPLPVQFSDLEEMLLYINEHLS